MQKKVACDFRYDPRNASKWQMGFNSAFKGLKVIPFTASSSSVLHSKAHPAPAQTTLAPLYPCSAQTASHVMCGQNEIHTKLKHSLHVPNCLRNSCLEYPDTKLYTLSLSGNKGSTRIVSCKLTSVIRCHRILPCKF